MWVPDYPPPLYRGETEAKRGEVTCPGQSQYSKPRTPSGQLLGLHRARSLPPCGKICMTVDWEPAHHSALVQDSLFPKSLPFISPNPSLVFSPYLRARSRMSPTLTEQWSPIYQSPRGPAYSCHPSERKARGNASSHSPPLHPHTEKCWRPACCAPHRLSTQNSDPLLPPPGSQTTQAEKRQAAAFQTSSLWCEVMAWGQGKI